MGNPQQLWCWHYIVCGDGDDVAVTVVNDTTEPLLQPPTTLLMGNIKGANNVLIQMMIICDAM